MKALPATENALVLRTDFSDDEGWGSIRMDLAEFADSVDEDGIFRGFS
jgi:hypothetical protein